MVAVCLEPAFLSGPELTFFLTVIAFISLSVFLLKTMKLSPRSRFAVIYVHLFGLIFVSLYFLTNSTCGILRLPCANNLMILAGTAFPLSIGITALLGYHVLPTLYVRSSSSIPLSSPKLNTLTRKIATRFSFPPPKLYLKKSPLPEAFSFRASTSAIFISIGLFDILNRKEVEAVILHELGHLKHYSSLMKLSRTILRLYPLSIILNFHSDPSDEEQKADAFAAQIQKTYRHLHSAKEKINQFHSQKRA